MQFWIWRSNQFILKEISPGISLEGMMLKLKLQYFGHLMRRADSLEKTLMLGGIGSRRRRGWQRMRWLDGHHWLDGHESEWTPGDGDGQGGLACCDSWGRKESDTTERLNWRNVDILFSPPCALYFFQTSSDPDMWQWTAFLGVYRLSWLWRPGSLVTYKIKQCSVARGWWIVVLLKTEQNKNQKTKHILWILKGKKALLLPNHRHLNNGR